MVGYTWMYQEMVVHDLADMFDRHRSSRADTPRVSAPTTLPVAVLSDSDGEEDAPATALDFFEDTKGSPVDLATPGHEETNPARLSKAEWARFRRCQELLKEMSKLRDFPHPQVPQEIVSSLDQSKANLEFMQQYFEDKLKGIRTARVWTQKQLRSDNADAFLALSNYTAAVPWP